MERYHVLPEFQDLWYGSLSADKIGDAIVSEEEIKRLAREWAQDGDVAAKLAELMTQVEEA